MTPAAELRRSVEPRDALRAPFERAWRLLPKHDEAALDDWAAAALELLHVNAGPSCHIAFWSLGASMQAPLRVTAASGRAAAQICRDAGARAAHRFLQSLPAALAASKGGPGLRAWEDALQRLAREAADCLAPACRSVEALLADGRGAVLADFVATGLKAHASDPSRRLAFFSLEDPRARALVARRPDVPGFEALSRQLAAFATALWGGVATLRAGPPSDSPVPRATVSGRVVLLPEATRARTPAEARALYLATVAHACAHLAQPPVTRPVGPFKPMQLVVIGLIEDARIEALALRAFPGLRRLWGPFHDAPPSGPRTAPNLMRRLSRALFDPLHEDADGFVGKGRRMFAEEAARGLGDPELSVRVGRVLGHDLGQMRVQFDWRAYAAEPAYRDDGRHLWEPPDGEPHKLDLLTEAARAGGAPSGAGGASDAGRAREADADDPGFVVATYPEWDAAAGVDRADWTTLREARPRQADARGLLAAMAAQPGPRRRIAALVRRSVVGRPARLKRQPDGDDLDLDAAVDAAVALRAGLPPETRLFRVTRPRGRDLATSILLDASASTAALLPDGRSVLDLQVLAVSLLGEALDARGDAFAVRAFASNGREDVRLTRIKDVAEPFDDTALRRLAGLRPELSTRLGAALRHARTEFAGARAWRRLLLVMTDGEPSDVDVPDARDLVADARRAALGLRHAGVDVFGVVLDPAGVGSAEAIFGRSNAIAVRDLADLPARLAGLYFRLARR